MKNRKAFTLVELMAVIVILGVILLIAVPSYNGFVKKAKEARCESDKKAIEDAANAYVIKLIRTNQTIPTYLSLDTLLTNGFLPNDYDKYKDNNNIEIAISNNNGNYTFTVPDISSYCQ